MGATDRGSQTIVHQYFEEAVASRWGKRHKDIRPRGIYSGGYLTKVIDSEVTLSPLVVEIGDNDLQISVRTAKYTLKNTNLDSGSIAPATPYIVLRWSYVATPGNYMEIHAIASVAAALANDIIVGKCVFVGSTLTEFDYTDRTFLNVQNLFLKVEPSEASELYVRVRAGRIQNTTGYVPIADQKVGPFSVPGGSNSRIDLVYVDTNGIVGILQGDASPTPSAPSYGGRLVLAEVKIVHEDASIPASQITDVRSFITNSTPVVSGIFGSWAARENNKSYLADTDGEVHAYSARVVGQSQQVIGYTGGNNPPTIIREWSESGAVYVTSPVECIKMSVRKGDYWKVTGASTVYWMPVGT